MTVRWGRAVLAGIAAFAVDFPVAVLLFGNPISRRIIFTTEFGQSSKLLANWQETPPLPPIGPFWEDLFVISAEKLWIGLLLTGILVVHAVIFQIAAPILPGTSWRRGVSFGAGIWALSYLFYEVFVPLNQLGEPLAIAIYEIALWLVVAVVEGVVIAAATGPIGERSAAPS